MAKQPETKQPDAKEFIYADDNWPQWPRLPIKRPPYDCALIGPTRIGGKVTVYHANLFQNITEATRTTTYESVDALLADGWVID
jgi:hypothetical protein